MITLPHELSIFIDSLDLIVPGLSVLQLNLQLSYRQRQDCFNGSVELVSLRRSQQIIFVGST